MAEIQERHEAVKDLEHSLTDLHQIFLDMSVLVEAQGEMLDNIEQQVGHATASHAPCKMVVIIIIIIASKPPLSWDIIRFMTLRAPTPQGSPVYPLSALSGVADGLSLHSPCLDQS